MKAFITRGDGIDGLSLVERATPKPNANEVLVNIRAASLNYRDLLVLSGKGSWRPAEPRVPLSDGAGEIVAVGGANLNRSLNALRMSGTISVIGLLGGGVGEVNTSSFFARNANLHGVEVGSRLMFEDMIAFIEQHRIKPVIDRVFDFSEVKEALNISKAARISAKSS